MDRRKFHPVELIKHAYDGAVEKMARLAAFSAYRRGMLSSDVEGRQEAFALDDLIGFSILARRLVVSVDAVENAKRTKLVKLRVVDDGKSLSFADSGKISMWDFLGVIVHSEDIRIFTNELSIHAAAGALTFDQLLERMLSSDNGLGGKIITPKIYVRSDRSGALVDLKEFIVAFDKDILQALVEGCAEHKIFLESDYRDF